LGDGKGIWLVQNMLQHLTVTTSLLLGGWLTLE